jgi:hypothetical protein
MTVIFPPGLEYCEAAAITTKFLLCHGAGLQLLTRLLLAAEGSPRDPRTVRLTASSKTADMRRRCNIGASMERAGREVRPMRCSVHLHPRSFVDDSSCNAPITPTADTYQRHHQNRSSDFSTDSGTLIQRDAIASIVGVSCRYGLVGILAGQRNYSQSHDFG